MQKFCIRETEYKIPKIDCIKLQSQSKLLGHFCDFSSPQYWCTRFGDWIAINNIGREKESTRKEKNIVSFKCPNYSCIFVWDCRFITQMTLRSKKKKSKKERKKRRKTRFLKFNIHKRPGLSLRFRVFIANNITA